LRNWSPKWIPDSLKYGRSSKMLTCGLNWKPARDIANLRERVTRLEVERGINRQ
jgi:hypothetical protein